MPTRLILLGIIVVLGTACATTSLQSPFDSNRPMREESVSGYDPHAYDKGYELKKAQEREAKKTLEETVQKGSKIHP